MASDEAKLFRERLKILRETKGLTQGQLEERIGKEANYITRVETGRIDTPPFDVIACIARELDVSMNDLFFFKGLDDSVEAVRARIHVLAQTNDVVKLRRYYRLMLVSDES